MIDLYALFAATLQQIGKPVVLEEDTLTDLMMSGAELVMKRDIEKKSVTLFVRKPKPKPVKDEEIDF